MQFIMVPASVMSCCNVYKICYQSECEVVEEIVDIMFRSMTVAARTVDLHLVFRFVENAAWCAQSGHEFLCEQQTVA